MIKKYLITVFIFLSFHVIGAAQSTINRNIQSALSNLNKSKADTNRIKILLSLATLYFNKLSSHELAHDSCNYFINEAESLSKALNYFPGLEDSYTDRIKVVLRQREIKIKNRQDATNELLKVKELEKATIALAEKTGNIQKVGLAFLKLADLYNDNEESTAEKIRLHEQALLFFRKTGDKKEEGNTLYNLGTFQLDVGQLEKAEVFLQQAVTAYQSVNRKDLQYVYSKLGSAYTMMNKFKLGLQYGLMAEKMAEELKDSTENTGLLYNLVGVTYEAIDEKETALKYYQQALAIEKKYNNPALINHFAANIYIIKAPSDLKAAVSFLEGIANKYPLDSEDEANVIVYNRLLGGYMGLKDSTMAQKYCDKLLSFSSKIPSSSPGQSFIMAPVIQFYMATRQFEKASKYISLFRDLAKKVGLLNSVRQSYFWDYQVQSALGNYQAALNSFKEFKATSDSIYTVGKAKEIAQLKIQYETEKKDKDLKLKEQDIILLTRQAELQQVSNEKKDRDLLLKQKDIALLTGQQELQLAAAEKKDQALQLKDQNIKLKEQSIGLLTKESLLKEASLKEATITRNIIIGGAFMLLLILGLGYKRYQEKQRSSKLINEKNIVLQQLVNEKEWLLKEVHHRVKNNLQTVVSLLESQSAYLQDDALLAIQDSQNRVHAMSLIHQKLYQSDNVASINMAAYLPELVSYLKESFNVSSIHFDTQIMPVDLDVSQAIPLGLIVNEAITNSIKYAFPGNSSNKQIHISMTQEPNNLVELRVADNGVGLQEDFYGKKSGSLGLKLMKGLSEDIDGQFYIKAENGTIVSVSFTANTPLHKINEVTHSKMATA
jgi:two-component system, sensor histidine kinase PdtaS